MNRRQKHYVVPIAFPFVVEVKGKIWLEDDSKFVLGEGRAELLRKVKELGSLTDAAKSMGMAYSHAWGEVKEMSTAAGGSVIETSVGGKDGGNSSLTDLGEKILTRFDEETKKLGKYLAKQNR